MTLSCLRISNASRLITANSYLSVSCVPLIITCMLLSSSSLSCSILLSILANHAVYFSSSPFGVSSLYSPCLLLAATSEQTEVLVFINENLFPESRNPKGLAEYKKAHTGHKNASTLQFQNADVFLARSSATSFIKAIETFSLPLTGSVHSMHISLALL